MWVCSSVYSMCLNLFNISGKQRAYIRYYYTVVLSDILVSC